MKKCLVFLFKAVSAGIAATAILSVIMSAYYVLPLRCDNKAKNTDYVWTPNSYWAKVTEGISYGKFDSDGFNNAHTVDNPDIIILGSSHMEAINVWQSQSTSAVLQQRLKNHRVYNMGISAHDFYRICHYLENSISRFDNVPDVVVMETDNVELKDDRVDAVLSGSIETPDNRVGKIVGIIQRIPFLRLLNSQINHGLLDVFKTKNAAAKPTDADKAAEAPDSDTYRKIMKYIAEIGDKYNTNIIVVYHPTETLNEDGTIEFKSRDESGMFAEAARENGVRYIDMAEYFSEMYKSKRQLPHGFCTGEVGTGHLNKYGHMKIAEALDKIITKMEEEGLICK